MKLTTGIVLVEIGGDTDYYEITSQHITSFSLLRLQESNLCNLQAMKYSHIMSNVYDLHYFDLRITIADYMLT